MDDIKKYTNKLICELPSHMKNSETPLKIDLILSGGAFNGSYTLGALFFLKEMEKQKYIKIDRISTCSISSIIGVLYFLDKLEVMYDNYNIFYNDFNDSKKITSLLRLNKYIQFTQNDLFRINHKLYISYYNIRKRRKIIKYFYKNVNDVYSSIIKSCYLPFLIDSNILYKKTYIDGITPYIFKSTRNVKKLYIDLICCGKLFNIFNVKYEYCNIHRIMSGILDIHWFFIKDFAETSMCSFVNNWSLLDVLRHYIILLIEKIIMIILCIYLLFDDCMIYLRLKNKLYIFCANIMYLLIEKIIKNNI
jgi:hypothetical protein